MYQCPVIKVAAVSIKDIILFLTAEALHMLDNWAMALIQTSISIYPYVVWFTVQFSGILKWLYSEQSLYWCTMVGVMKH